MLNLGERISIYQPEQNNLQFPQEFKTDNLAALRQRRKRHLVAACRAFAQWNFDYGFAGHLTVRDPENPELYWTNPMAVHFGQVKFSNLILVDHDGRVVEGNHAVNRAGFVLHAAVHAEHPDILAMCHAHTEYGVAYATLGRSLPPISQDVCAFFEDHVVILDDAGKVAVETDAGNRVAKSFKGITAAIHQNHGLLLASRHSIDAAAWRFMALERCCKQQLLIDAAGHTPIEISAERARYSREHVGSEYIAWLSFQTVYNDLEIKYPDMFD